MSFSTLSCIMPQLPDDLEPPSPSQTDAELYQALRAGYTAGLGILYDRHAGLIYGLALKVLGTPQEAEDLTQDIFLNLARSTAYDPRRGSLRTFLAILTRSRALDRLRSRSTARSLLDRFRGSTSETISPFEQVFEKEQSEEVQAALAQLSESEQQILRLAYYEGLSQSEIAKRLNLPLGTVKTKTRRSLLKLRNTLTDSVR